MTPTELEILRRHAKPGHEEALVDIVTLIVERARSVGPPESWPLPWAPLVPFDPLVPGPTAPPVEPLTRRWAEQQLETWNDNKLATLPTVPSFPGSGRIGSSVH